MSRNPEQEIPGGWPNKPTHMKQLIIFIISLFSISATGQRTDIVRLRPAPETAGRMLLSDTTANGAIRYMDFDLRSKLGEYGYTYERTISNNAGDLNRSLSSSISYESGAIYTGRIQLAGWVTGAGIGGSQLISNNFGASFSQPNSLDSLRINTIECPTKDTCYAFGIDAKLTNKGLRSIDGGATYANITVSNIGEAINGTYWLNSTTGWVCGDNSKIYKTTNAGSTWTAQSASGGAWKDISFANANYGLMCTASGTCKETTNGGSSWTSRYPAHGCNAVKYRSQDTTAILVGATGRISRFKNAAFTEVTSGTTNPLHSVDFIDQSNGVAVGDSGTILITTDGGTTWAAKPSGTNLSLKAVTWYQADTLYATGANQIVLASYDGGDTWTTTRPGYESGKTGLSIAALANGKIRIFGSSGDYDTFASECVFSIDTRGTDPRVNSYVSTTSTQANALIAKYAFKDTFIKPAVICTPWSCSVVYETSGSKYNGLATAQYSGIIQIKKVQ